MGFLFFFFCRKLEHVVVTILELEAHRRGDVRLELTSPSKTEVIILKESRYDISWEGFKDQRILSLVSCLFLPLEGYLWIQQLLSFFKAFFVLICPTWEWLPPAAENKWILLSSQDYLQEKEKESWMASINKEEKDFFSHLTCSFSWPDCQFSLFLFFAGHLGWKSDWKLEAQIAAYWKRQQSIIKTIYCQRCKTRNLRNCFKVAIICISKIYLLPLALLHLVLRDSFFHP